ncbi:MAG: DedA family protein [Thermodesulfobacteriota bacterium]
MNIIFPGFTYLSIAFLLIGRGIGVPAPEDLTLITAGFLCAKEICELELMIPLAWISVIAADCLSFGCGALFRTHHHKLPVIKLMFTRKRLYRAEKFYLENGIAGILLARFLPGLKTPLFFTAGAARFSFLKFLIIDTITSIISVSVVISAGFYLSKQLYKLKDAADLYKGGVIIFILILIAGGLAFKFLRKNN